MAKKINEGHITESRVQEATSLRNDLFIELVAQVLHEQLVIERPILRERLANLVDLSGDKYDKELRDTLYALINKL